LRIDLFQYNKISLLQINFWGPQNFVILVFYCTNNLLVRNQFGFRKGTATEDAIFKLTNEILKALNNKTLAGSIFCDLEKAYDSVNHDILLSKLSYYRISGKAKSLLKSYLQNTYQRVLITNSLFNSNTVSNWTKIKCEVLQSSILGPLLFLFIH